MDCGDIVQVTRMRRLRGSELLWSSAERDGQVNRR